MLKRLIVDIHRRSLWQVLTIYLVGAWVALQVVDALTNTAGLPDWVPPFALVLLIIGMPIVLATAFVQEGMPGSTPAPAPLAQPTSPDADRAAPVPAVGLAGGADSLDLPTPRRPTHRRLLTWRNAIMGGVAAFALLGAAVSSYFVMRVTGIGPAASLSAQGVFAEREPIMLADFGNTTSDSTLGDMVTEALRVDLLQSPAVTILPPSHLAEALRRAGHASTAALTAELAREIAEREGVKAVIQGDVGAVGSGYVLTASIVDPATGAALAAFRETAAGDAQLLDAIDRLSNRIREKAGESLRSIRAGEPLSAVTTGSLDALRAYTRAIRMSNVGDRDAAVSLLETAIELDPEFAMAYRKLGAELFSQGMDPQRVRDAMTRAYELRSRLTAVERLNTEASYHQLVAGDRTRAIAAYRELLRDHPDNPSALNNLANLLNRSRAEATESVELFRRAFNGPGVTPSAYNNILISLWGLRREDEIAGTLAEAVQRYPDHFGVLRNGPMLLAMQRNYTASHAAMDTVMARFPSSAVVSFQGASLLAASDVGRGLLREAREHRRNAAQIARERNQAAWVVNNASLLAYTELMVARSPQRAREILRELQREEPIESLNVSHWTFAAIAIVAAFAGDAETGRRARAGLERVTETEAQTPDHLAAFAWHDWAAALAREDGEAALDASARYATQAMGSCDGRRCVGFFERGMALERLGRTADAIAAYEQHMAGMSYGEMTLDAIYTPLALERLGELYEQQADPARAAENYARFVELWKDADAELQPRVRRAAERAAALLAPRG
jgi:eukaryotic-like serine/threonine-protein kinase